MKLKEFRIGVAKTINLGNYESLRVEAQVVYEVSENDELKDISSTAQAELRYLLAKTYREQYAKKVADESV